MIDGLRFSQHELNDLQPASADGPDTVLVHAADGRDVNEVLGRGGVWASQIMPERAGLEEAYLQLTEKPEAKDAAATR